MQFDQFISLYCRSHYHELIPFLVMRKDFDSTRQMAKAMGKEWLPLLEKTLPKIVVHIFPHFAAGEFTIYYVTTPFITRQ